MSIPSICWFVWHSARKYLSVYRLSLSDWPNLSYQSQIIPSQFALHRLPCNDLQLKLIDLIWKINGKILFFLSPEEEFRFIPYILNTTRGLFIVSSLGLGFSFPQRCTFDVSAWNLKFYSVIITMFSFPNRNRWSFL